MNNLNDAAEIAFSGYLTSIIGQQPGPAYSVFTGKSNAIKTAPCVIVASDGEENEEEPFHTGNFWINVSVFVKSAASTDVDAQGNLVDSKAPDVNMAEFVFEALQIDNLDSLVNTPDFMIFPTAYIFMSPKCGRDPEGIWVSELSMRVYCCGNGALFIGGQVTNPSPGTQQGTIIIDGGSASAPQQGGNIDGGGNP